MSFMGGAARTEQAADAAVSTRPSTGLVRAMYYVSAEADPGLLSRLIAPVAKLGHVPSRVHASRESGDGSEITVDLRLSDVPARAAELVERNLRAVLGVHQVIAVFESC